MRAFVPCVVCELPQHCAVAWQPTCTQRVGVPWRVHEWPAVPAWLLTPACTGARRAGKHVVFGQVTEGAEVVKAVEALGTSSGRTKKTVTITECGQLA